MPRLYAMMIRADTLFRHFRCRFTRIDATLPPHERAMLLFISLYADVFRAVAMPLICFHSCHDAIDAAIAMLLPC